jgi:hypothetical protein
VRVHARASRSAIVGWEGGTLRVAVTEAPEAGRANRAVTELLARTLGVAPSSLALVRGATARDKFFRVGGLAPAEVRARLAGASS